jgi:hypothetical protein
VDIKEAFAATLSRIELNPTRVQLASQRYNAIKQVIEQTLPGKTVTQIGSFQRKTKIRPLDLSDKLDIDLLVKFKTVTSLWGEFFGLWGTPGGTLKEIQKVLIADQTYRMMGPKPDAPTVLLTYADQFTFEIVPALVDKTGRYNHQSGGPDCYLVGLKRDTWSPADYDYEAAYISSLNTQTGGRLVPSIKLIKAFLRGHGLSPDPLKSFHIEILCARIIPPVIASWETYGLTWGYHQVLAYFLCNVGSQLASPVALPNSYSPPIQVNLSPTDMQTLKSKVDQLGQSAQKLCRLKDTPDTLKRWREFFGDPFRT